MANIVTSKGLFNIVENESNKQYTDVYKDGQRIATVRAYWWNADEVEKAIDKLDIESNEQPKVNGGNVCSMIEEANKLLREMLKDNNERGFVCSRLSQVVNKLKNKAA